MPIDLFWGRAKALTFEGAQGFATSKHQMEFKKITEGIMFQNPNPLEAAPEGGLLEKHKNNKNNAPKSIREQPQNVTLFKIMTHREPRPGRGYLK